MHKVPDFIGNWMLPDDEEQFKIRNQYAGITRLEYQRLSEMGLGLFFMLINKGERQISGSISGMIIDNIKGLEATFEGFLSEDSIKFVKVYSPEAVRSGFVSTGEIPYEGRKISMLEFKGKYHMSSQCNELAWNGQFILRKCVRPSIN